MHKLSQFFQDESSLDAALRHLCRVPDPLESAEEAERWAHEDLAQLRSEEIRREREALRLWVRLQVAPSPWRLERLKRLEGCLRRGR